MKWFAKYAKHITFGLIGLNFLLLFIAWNNKPKQTDGQYKKELTEADRIIEVTKSNNEVLLKAIETSDKLISVIMKKDSAAAELINKNNETIKQIQNQRKNLPLIDSYGSDEIRRYFSNQ